jgi:uncharacterized protein YoxC
VKQLLIGLLNLLGLVPARRYHFLTAQLHDAESQVKKLSKQVSTLEASSIAWKEKANDALKQLKAKADEVDRHAARVEKIKQEVEKANQRGAEIEAMHARVVEAQRELVAAREQLMAVEVKLDILEGAANVLDMRTRSTIVRQRGETGAPV